MIAWASYPYTNTTVLVTGAGSGIGRAIARAFLEQGATVAVCGRREEPLRETVAGFPPEQTVILVGDMSTADDIERVVDDATATLGSLDVVIANAGLSERLLQGWWPRRASLTPLQRRRRPNHTIRGARAPDISGSSW